MLPKRSGIEFRVLGTLEIRDGAGQLLTPPRRKQRLLLAVLLLRANTPVSTDALLDLLWPEAAPASARANLQSYVSDLRRLLAAAEPGEPSRLRREAGGYQLRADPEEVDAAVFVRLAGEGRKALAEERYAAAAERLARAVARWRGPVLEGLPLPAALQPDCERLEELRMTALEDGSQARLELAEPAVLAAELAELTSRHPLRERLWAHLMLALYRAGRQADALEAYQRVYRLLDEELGVRPGPALQSLHQQILAADPALNPASLATRLPSQLPAPPQAFTGRTQEIAHLDQALDASTVVISAIDGMAGIGKTALAVHLAHRIAGRYPDGQLFVDLHGHTPGMAPREPAEALDHLLRSLGVPGRQIPAGLDDRAALYRTRLADQRVLILLDDAATEAQVAPLLPGSPGCRVLITSRRRLAGLDHTHSLSLDTLPAPDAADLFVRSAGAGRLSEEQTDLVPELVELCGRLPLAIRIAAARLRSHPTWDLAHLVRRLRDGQRRLAELEAGERSVTATLDLSCEHLDPAPRRAYALLGLHPGRDVDPYAAAALLDVPLEQASQALDQLLDAHLLQEPAPGRYSFHDLVRAHAARHEIGPDRPAAAGRLLDHYRHTAALAVDAAYPYEREWRPDVPPARTPGPDLRHPAAALAWLDSELPNLLAVARHGRSEHVVHLSAILHWHLRSRGRYHDAETLHREALRTAGATGNRAGELDTLTSLGQIYRLQGRYPEAIDHFGQSLRTARDTGHRAGELDALTGLGHINWRQGRYPRATENFAEALRIARAIGHRSGELEALTGLGRIHWTRGEPGQAAERFAQALEIARATGHRLGELNALAGLGQIDRLRGRYPEAIVHFEQALRIARATGQRIGELSVLTGLGQVLRRQGEHERAVRDYRHLLALARDSGDRNYEFEARQGLGRLSRASGDPDAAAAHHDAALRLADELGQPVDQARAHDGLAHAHHAKGEREVARKHWRQALDLTAIDLDHTDDEETTAEAIRASLAALDAAR